MTGPTPFRPVTVTTGGTLATPEPLAQRIRRQWSGAKADACEHVDQLRAALAEVARIAGEIVANPPEPYPVGAYDMARRLAEEEAARAMTLHAINERARAS